jgi:1-acyl-sn-glycerol-3-phosphate acyltransferase
MRWMHLADALWTLRPWMLPVFAALYLVPIARIAGFPLEYGGRLFMRINRRFGQWEHIILWPRDTIATAYLSGAIIWHAFVPAAPHEEWVHALTAVVAALLIASSAIQASFRRRCHNALIEFTGAHPDIHPQEFFDHLLCCSGIVRHVLPHRPFCTVDYTNMDFTGGKARFLRIYDKIIGGWSTIWIGKLILQATSRSKDDALKRITAALAHVWSSRVMQISRSRFTFENIENLPEDRGTDIFLFNHMSFMDFALAPIALTTVGLDGKGELRTPLFLLAKDHFRHNVLYYHILGIGKVAEALGMIFVERGGEAHTIDRAKMIVQEAVSRLVEGKDELAIYPQGKRSAPYIDREGLRLDSAYYTVGGLGRIKSDGAHLKKGAAHIAISTAMALASSRPECNIRLIPIAIFGTGIACPRGTSKILTNVHMRMKVGEIITIHPSQAAHASLPAGARPTSPGEDAYFDLVEKLHTRIDVALKTALHVHATIERRFFEDIRDMLDALQHEEIAVAIKPWRGDDYLFHAILDAIYACPQARWRSLHGELVHLLLNFAPRSDVLAFKARVAEEILIR